MKCPKCGKDVILQKKQVGVDENGNPVLNEYAICKDCKKQWNLDKQRAKKSAPKPAASVAKHTEAAPKQEAPKAPVEKTEETKASGAFQTRYSCNDELGMPTWTSGAGRLSASGKPSGRSDL